MVLTAGTRLGPLKSCPCSAQVAWARFMRRLCREHSEILAMISRNRLAIVVFGIGSVGAAAWAYVGVRSVLRMLNEGGFFGSAGIFELLKYLVPFLLTLRLSVGMRHWGRLGRIVQRAYLLALFAILWCSLWC